MALRSCMDATTCSSPETTRTISPSGSSSKLAIVGGPLFAGILADVTGSYRTGGDVLVTQADGSSEISGTDFALAYVDEIEQHAHPRQRFTVGH